MKAELKDKDKEIVKLKSAVYDLSQKLEETRKKGKNKGKDLNSPPVLVGFAFFRVNSVLVVNFFFQFFRKLLKCRGVVPCLYYDVCLGCLL